MSSSQHKAKQENTCNYCLYFQQPPTSQRKLAGNCTHHKEWIEKPARTTCSDMSNRPLKKGIYQLLEQPRGQLLYIRRKERLRTRLFLVKKDAGRVV
ncbi:MAG: hypothetical protein E6J89_20270 [Deltaproteobacteria bacterium]|nr:MAG: hypothetical protein E6J89_20270 [Deltaproteobacteria bacterium]